MKIFIAENKDFDPVVIEKLKKTAFVIQKECQLHEIKGILENYDVFWFRLAFKIDENVLSERTKCKVIATPVTGIDHIDLPACQKYGIKVICLRGETEFLKTVRATAELTLAITLALYRNVVPAAVSVNSGLWQRDLFRGKELYGKTAGIIGVGRLGSIVASYFIAFGMKVIGWDIEVGKTCDGVQMKKTLDEVLSNVDVLSIHVSLNETSKNLIGEKEFSKMKTSSILINTSRGGILNEEALLEALKSGQISGAALDVIKNEHNFNINNPLVQYARDNKNLLIVPHIGGNTYESFAKTESFIADKIIELISQC